MASHCSGVMSKGRHMRGLELKICRVLQPRRQARSAEVSTPPAVEVWMPMRREADCGR